jgi:hypothetical protein
MTMNTVADTAVLEWQRTGKYHSCATNGPYTVAGFKLGDEIRYRASRQRNFIGGVYDSPDEAKQVCQNNFLILGQTAED